MGYVLYGANRAGQSAWPSLAMRSPKAVSQKRPGSTAARRTGDHSMWSLAGSDTRIYNVLLTLHVYSLYLH